MNRAFCWSRSWCVRQAEICIRWGFHILEVKNYCKTLKKVCVSNPADQDGKVRNSWGVQLTKHCDACLATLPLLTLWRCQCGSAGPPRLCSKSKTLWGAQWFLIITLIGVSWKQSHYMLTSHKLEGRREILWMHLEASVVTIKSLWMFFLFAFSDCFCRAGV